MSKWANVPDPTYTDPNVLGSGVATMGRLLVNSLAVLSGSGSLRLAYFTAPTAIAATGVRLYCGSTPAGATPTLAKVGLYSVAVGGDLSLIASTANTPSLFGTAGNAYEPAFQAGVTLKSGARYAVGVLVVTTVTAPTYMGNNVLTAAEAARAPRTCALLPGQADLPASIPSASLVISGNMIYAAVS